jgi:hypothetical protein
VPLVEGDSMEQELCLMRENGGSFEVVEKIMKTAFSQRVDRQGMSEKDMS